MEPFSMVWHTNTGAQTQGSADGGLDCWCGGLFDSAPVRPSDRSGTLLPVTLPGSVNTKHRPGRFNMVRKLSAIALVAGAMTAGAVFSAQAASRVATGVPEMRADSVTGCLQKGDKKGTYSLTDKMGNKHWVTSKTVPLDKHVGHTVTLSGSSMMSDNSKMMDSGKMSGMSDSSKMGAGKMSSDKMGMSGAMDVTSLSMVSASCS